MEKLVNGTNCQTHPNNYVTFRQFYDEHNEYKKAEIRAKLSLLFNLTETSVFRKIRNEDFDTHDLRKMYIHFSICYSPKQGFFLEPNVSKNETLNKYGLTF